MADVALSSQEIIDNEHLRILSIVYYVMGGLSAALSCILIFHFIFGLVIAFAPQVFPTKPGEMPPTFFGLIMSGFAGCIMVLGWAIGGLTIYSGICIKRRQHRTFSLVMAALNCLSIPFGTALGIFTMIVLTRDSIRRQYEGAPLATGDAAPAI